MSHYTVLVVGKNPEELLEPYNENMEVDKYEIGVVEISELRTFHNHYKEKYPEDKNLNLIKMYEKYGEDWNNKIWEVKKTDFGENIFIEYSTNNPLAKWDWYQLGGRWSDFFTLKDGSTENTCLKKDVDINIMLNNKKKDYSEEWEIVNEAVQGMKLEKSWKSYLEDYRKETITIDEAREEFNNQPIVRVFERLKQNTPSIGYFKDISDFLITKEKYIDLNSKLSITTHSILNKEDWIEKGSMGWFGISSDTVSDEDWAEIFFKYFNSIEDKETISIYDCHI